MAGQVYAKFAQEAFEQAVLVLTKKKSLPQAALDVVKAAAKLS